MGKDEEEGKLQTASVTFLDGTVNEYKIHRGSYGEVLFTNVSNGMSVEEKDHFSLCFFDNQGTRHWLYNDKKIMRQLKGLPWVFSFEVKFYPLSPATLKDDTARHMLYLQCREDIKNGKLGASLPTRASLAALIAQCEFGDASATAEYEQYVRGCTEGEDLGEKLKSIHTEHKGMNGSEAESAYLNECKELSTYGVWQFPAKDSKGVDVCIGISAQGLMIFREAIRLHRFPWQSIVKISYRRHYFSVKIKAGEMEKKESTLTYDSFTYEDAKRVWKCGVEHHTFFRLIQPDQKTKGSIFHWGSSPFRFQGRTSFQNKMASQMFDQPTNVVRSPESARHVISLERVDNVGTLSNVAVNDENAQGTLSPSREYVIGVGGTITDKRKNMKEDNKKTKKSKKGGQYSSHDSSSDSSDENEHEISLKRANEELGEARTTVASWKESSEDPGEIVYERDEHGNIKESRSLSSHTRHSVHKHTFQNYLLDPKDGMDVEMVHSELTPIDIDKKGSSMDTWTRSVEYSKGGIEMGREEMDELVSTKSITCGNRTVETLTYKRIGEDGRVETHIEHRVTIHSENPIDHDAELSTAILEATQMNPDMHVEKIEVRQESTH